MGNISGAVKSRLGILFEKGEEMRISDIRRTKLVYFLAYAFELMIFNARGQFMPIGMDIFGISGWTVIKAFHGIASLVFMFLWTAKFKKLVNISVILMIVGFVPFAFLPNNYARLIFGIIFYIGLGGAVTSARCGYAFVCNNTERLIGMIIMFFSVIAIRVISFSLPENNILAYIVMFSLLAAFSVCLIKFKEDDFEVKEKSDKSDEKGIYWALVYFIAYFAVDGFSAGMAFKSAREEYPWFLIGMLIAGIILFATIIWFKFSTWHIWNIFFVFSILMAVFALFSDRMGTLKPQYFFNGLSRIGWPLCIYTLGCAQKNFASLELMKKSTLIFVIMSPVSVVISDIAYDYFYEYFSAIALVYIVTMVVFLLMFSPFSYKYLFSAVWIKYIFKADMEVIKSKVEETDKFAEYGLTPRQREVAVLLLAAKTRRQIAGELGLSESTVKMHTSDLYKKLGINSKAELFKIFAGSDIKAESES